MTWQQRACEWTNSLCKWLFSIPPRPGGKMWVFYLYSLPCRAALWLTFWIVLFGVLVVGTILTLPIALIRGLVRLLRPHRAESEDYDFVSETSLVSTFQPRGWTTKVRLIVLVVGLVLVVLYPKNLIGLVLVAFVFVLCNPMRLTPEGLFGLFRFRTVRYAWHVLAFPIRFLSLIVAFVVLASTSLLWHIPIVAHRHDVNTLDLLERGVAARPTDPLVILTPDTEFERAKIPFRAPEEGPIERIETVQKGPYHYEHHVLFSTRTPTTITTSTPYTRLSREELQTARTRVQTLYPTANEAEWKQLVRWGTLLRVNWWNRQRLTLFRNVAFRNSWEANLNVVNADAFAPASHGYQSRRVSPRAAGLRRQINEEEALWFAWQRFTAGNPHAKRDLPRLANLIDEAYPEEAARTAALAWADALYHRHHAFLNATLTYRTASGREFRHRFQGSLPPNSDFTRAWLLYQYVGLTDASREFVRQRWLHYFPNEKAELALQWGRELEANRRASGEPLPPTCPNVALFCAVERMAGTDPYGYRCKSIIDAELRSHPPYGSAMMLASLLGYPNDEFYYLLSASDPFHLYTHLYSGLDSVGPGTGSGFLCGSVLLLSLLAVFSLGLRGWLFDILGGWAFKLKGNPHFLEFQEQRRRLRWREFVVSYLAVPLLTWPIAWLTLSPRVRLLVDSPFQLLVGVYASILLGGTILVFLSRVISLVLIARGYDLKATWLDEVIGLSLGAAVLCYFGIDPLSITSYLAFALIPEVLIRKPRQFDPRSDEQEPPVLRESPHATHQPVPIP